MNIDREVVRAALDANRDFLEQALETYRSRQIPRPILCLVGYGQAGKDEAASHIARLTGRRYGGSTSRMICPVVAHILGKHPEEAFLQRHEDRMFWYQIGNLMREEDPTLLSKLLLSQSDFVVGTRDKVELEETVRSGLVDLTVWVSNPRVPADPTVQFDEADCDITICNAGSLAQYHKKLEKLVELTFHGTHHSYAEGQDRLPTRQARNEVGRLAWELLLSSRGEGGLRSAEAGQGPLVDSSAGPVEG